MADFDSMVDAVQELFGNHSRASDAIVGRAVNSAHRYLLESYQWSRRKQEILLITAADESTGTFTVTNGSATATGSASVSLSSADVGKYIRFGSDDVLYVVGAVSGQDVTLQDLNGTNRNYHGTTSTTASYVMFQRWISLGSGIEQLFSVNYKQKLDEVDATWIDSADPSRQSTGDPTKFARGPRNLSGTSDLARIEVWPRPASAVGIRCQVEVGHTTLSGTTNPIVPSGVVEWYAARRTAYTLFSLTKDARFLALAKEWKEEAEASLARELAEDNRKFGLSQAVKDVGGGVGLGATDFALDHDVGII